MKKLNSIIEAFNKLNDIYIISFLALCLLAVWCAKPNEAMLSLMSAGFGAVFQSSRNKQKPSQQNFDVDNLENANISVKEKT